MLMDGKNQLDDHLQICVVKCTFFNVMKILLQLFTAIEILLFYIICDLVYLSVIFCILCSKLCLN
jgi:hypothetical protein